MSSLLHASDVHFGPRHLPAVAAGLLALAGERRPDAVVVSGDLTQRARPSQFRAARWYFERFAAPVLAVPGNHDVPMYRVWERALWPFGAYRRHFAADLEPVVRAGDLFLVGVNTAFNWTVKGGRVRATQARRLQRVFAAAPADACRIVVAHHHLVRAPGFDGQRVLHSALGAAAAFSAAGVEVVLSGHHHVAWAGSSAPFFPLVEPPFLIVHSGTTTSDRYRAGEPGANTCNWIDVGAHSIAVTTLRWNGAAGRFEEQARREFARRRG